MNMKLFITTKNLDYIRNAQEIAMLSEGDEGKEPDIIGSPSKSYVRRMAKVITGLFTVDFKKYDEVFVGFAPQLVIPLFCQKFRRYRKSGGKVTIDFFISVYDTLVNDRKKIKPGTVAAKFTAWLDRKTITFADRIIVDTKADGRYFAEEFGMPESKMQVLYLEADKTVYYPRNKETVTSGENVKTVKTVVYFASMLPLQGADIVLKAAQLMKDDSDVRFKIIGPVKNKVIQDNITYIEWLTQNELADAVADADLCLAGHFNADIDKASRTIPGKAYIYQAMEKPMVLGDNPANRELFDESMTGIYFCRMGDADSLRDAIETALKGVN